MWLWKAICDEPDSLRSFDAAPPHGIALSEGAGTVADNYQRCHENAEQLILLQSWIRQVSGGE